MALFSAAPYRPTGLATADQALASVVQLLEWGTALVSDALEDDPDWRQAASADRELLNAAAGVLRDVAAMLDGRDASPDLGRLERSRAASTAHQRMLSDGPGSSDAGARRAVHAQTIALAARTAAADAMIAARRADPETVAAERRRWYGGQRDSSPARRRFPALTGAIGLAAPHASLRSVWFRSSARGAAALAVAVAVADLSSVQHGFWVVLGTLSVLRTNAVATGSTVGRALLGTAAGFVVGAALLLAIGTSTTALWVTLPIAVLVASYTPGTAPFAVGQAAFTVTVLVLFNLLAPAGWKVGLWSLVMATTRLRLTAHSLASLPGSGVHADPAGHRGGHGDAGPVHDTLRRLTADLARFYERVAVQVGPPSHEAPAPPAAPLLMAPTGSTTWRAPARRRTAGPARCGYVTICIISAPTRRRSPHLPRGWPSNDASRGGARHQPGRVPMCAPPSPITGPDRPPGARPARVCHRRHRLIGGGGRPLMAPGSAGGGPGGRRPVQAMRVLSWNLWWRYGPWELRREAIAATLAEAGPDLCGLQEVWGAPGENLAADLAERLGMHWCWAVAAEGRGGGGDELSLGNAILSRWPITARAQADLPTGELMEERRVAVHARIDAPRGALPMFTTHLTYGLGRSQVRMAQVRALAQFVAEHAAGCAYPPVVTGDLNAEPGSDELRLLGGVLTAPAVTGLVLVDAWRYADPGDPGLTWDHRNGYLANSIVPDSRIDYVLAGPPRQGRGRVRSAGLAGTAPVDNVWPSDHFAVVAELQQ
jgi:endonuclease/exonuclease/phosphatase family metal-dependent hydrolase